VSLFYVLYGHPERRRWEDARRYGFISAGGGRRWSRPLERLSIGDEILVNVPNAGYVGHGTVTGPIQAVAEFHVETDAGRQPLLSQPLVSAGLAMGDRPDEYEYAVPVTWIKTVSERQAYWRIGLFHRRTTVWPFDNPTDAEEVISNL
jgi:hypothetical protein